MNVLYVVPNLKKVSGGPRTRISMFKKVFKQHGGATVERGGKLFSAFKFKRVDLLYIESATNRIGFIDIVSLFLLKLKSKVTVVFIRDVYIELFPDEYKTFRGKITRIANKLSNYYLTKMGTHIVFPTKGMGEVFFYKNKAFPKRPFDSLPPGTIPKENKKRLPEFNKKIGILYLGSTKYTNSGFEHFLNFSKEYSNIYNCYVLSGDKNLEAKVANTSINLNSVAHSEIADFIEENNIAFAIHTRPRNNYDDITFPIKILDFVSLQIPFFTEKHKPLEELLGDDYGLFIDITKPKSIHDKIANIDYKTYLKLVSFLKDVALLNTYETRYKKLLEK